MVVSFTIIKKCFVGHVVESKFRGDKKLSKTHITFLFKMVQFAAKSCGRSLDQLPIANDADCSVKILPRVALADGIR